jgi:1-phosphofructokinase family hexose kinase
VIATVTLNPALDKTVYIDRLLPNDTNRIKKIEMDAGGKGINAARVLKELGTETVALGFLGGRTGRQIENELKHEGVPTDFVWVARESRTNISVQEASGAPPTMLNEPGPTVSAKELEQLRQKVSSVASKSEFVLLGGSPAPGTPVDVYHDLCGMARSQGAKVILDSEGEPMMRAMDCGPYMIKPNRDEVRRLVGIDIRGLDDGVKALEILRGKGIELVVISMGSKGAIAGNNDGIWSAVPPKVKPVSTIGSGDSMVAGIAHILSQDGGLDEALRWGTAAGAATAMTDGTEICKRPQVLELLDKVEVRKIA